MFVDGNGLTPHSSASQNDKLLHKLIHTKLLSGSLNPSLELSSAQRKKALAGRVLETAQYSKLGQGEKVVRTAEHNKAPKNVRFGMMDKAKERRLKELEEVKDLWLKQLHVDMMHRPEPLGTTIPLSKGSSMLQGTPKLRSVNAGCASALGASRAEP
jgi:hypothetical protein